MAVGASRFAQQPDQTWQGENGGPSSTGLRSWLLEGIGYSNVTRNLSGDFIIECHDDSWSKANASDLIANREAAKESLHPRQNPAYGNKSLAWPIITAYYAAYFSAQSFLRCLGLGSIYIENGEANNLNTAWLARHFSAGLQASNYGFEIQLTTPIKIVLRTWGSSGGAHKQFWEGFRRSQNAIGQVLLISDGLNTLSAYQRQTAHNEYKRLIDQAFGNSSSITKTLDFQWLSSIRNKINYRFSDNVWLMNWQHTTGLIPNQELLIERYKASTRSLPDAQRNYSKRHLAFVATRFCQIVEDATTSLSPP